jgi:hypothetical protein
VELDHGLRRFCAHIIGTNHPSTFEWINVSLDKPAPLSRKQRADEYVHALTLEQQAAFERFHEAKFGGFMLEAMRVASTADGADKEEDEAEGTAEAVAEIDLLGKARAELEAALGDRWDTFVKEIEPLVDTTGPEGYQFDLGIVQRWLFERVLELGWTEARFGEFDIRSQHPYTRDPRTQERIGKKYQWIALHECLARISDNFHFRPWTGSGEQYDGPWQVHRRDIDPTLLTTTSRRTGWWDDTPATWWAPWRVPSWEPDDEGQWLRREDLPRLADLTSVKDPTDGSEWLVVDGGARWTLHSQGIERDLKRDVSYELRAYAVRADQFAALLAWAREANLANMATPDSGDFYKVFMGEYPWAPAYLDARRDGPRDEWHEWTKAPSRVRLLSDTYHVESSDYDKGIEENFTVLLPAKWIVEGMALDWRGHEGLMFDGDGLLIARDPSLAEPGRSALLLRRDQTIRFMRDAGLELLWVFRGERRSLIHVEDPMQYPGETEITGVAFLRDGQIDEVKHSTFFTLSELQARNYA